VLLVLPLAVRAEGPTETVIRMAVQPKATPRPALKYQLLPELAELNPGNPILGYLRCFSEQNHFFFDKKSAEDRDRWLEMPLQDLPVKELRGYGGLALRQADYAARLDTPDWQILPKLKKEGVHLLIPDVQQIRLLAAALQVRLRGEVADRRFDDAVVTAKTMFALSRHVSEHPTLIGDLVAIAIAQITVGGLDEMMSQPGSPNLYWALTDLPHPLISIHKGLQAYRMMLTPEVASLDEHAPMTDVQLARVMERLHLMLLMTQPGADAGKVKALQDRFLARVGDAAHVQAARKRLVEAGLKEAAVKQFPPAQVVLLDEKHAYEVERDELLKAMSLPYWQAEAVWARQRPAAGGKEESLSAWLLLPLTKVRAAQVRLEQRLGLLRCVEALRLYAAGHGGRLPAKLADTGVPVPDDPVTGRPFPYHLDGAAGSLRGTPPRGMERNAWFNIRYEITIKK
jgi:hypothetical protein